jgi:hypothetical protein
MFHGHPDVQRTYIEHEVMINGWAWIPCRGGESRGVHCRLAQDDASEFGHVVHCIGGKKGQSSASRIISQGISLDVLLT